VIELIVPLAAAQNPEGYLLGSRILEAILFLVVGAGLGMLGQLLLDARKREVEDYELWVEIHEASQKAEGIGRLNTGLSIHAGDREVEDPYVVDFYVWGVGKKDVRSEQFDGRALKFKLNVPIITELEGSTQGNIESARFSFTPDGVVSLAPSLIRARAAKRYRFLTDGKPRLEVINPVADLKVFDFAEQWETPSKDRVIAKWLARILVGLMVVAFLAVMGLGIFRSIVEGPQPPTLVSSDEIGPFGVITDEDLADLPWWIFLVPLGIPLTAALFSYGAAPSRRPKRAAQLRRENLEPSGAPALKTQRHYLNINAESD
jgi:hypothetical protein